MSKTKKIARLFSLMFEVVLILFCLLINAFLSCFEMAFVTVSKPHLKKLADEGDLLARRVLQLKLNPERVLSVLQIGITLVGAISAAVGGASAEESLSPLFQSAFGISEELSETLSIIAVVIPITFFSVVIGELVPKTLALKFPMKFARNGGVVLAWLDKAFSPVVHLLEFSTKIIISLFLSRISNDSIAESTSSIEIHDLSDSHKLYVVNLLAIDKCLARDIMLPWNKVTTLSSSLRASQVMEVVRKSGHTRIPVLEGVNPIGILHSKEFIAENEIAKIDWLQLVRPAIFISAEEPILNTLKQMQSLKSHMAILKGSPTPLGIITLEDIFEEIVGEIYDEDDSPRSLLTTNSRIRSIALKKPGSAPK